MRRFATRVLIALTVIVGLMPAAHAANVDATHSDNMRHIDNIKYKLRHGQTKSYGTDIEFARINGRRYAFAGSYLNGLQIIDITNPERAFKAANYDCGILQGDVQVFRRGTRTFVTYTSENTSSIKVESRCVRELAPKATEENKKPAYGTYIINVTNPQRPRSAGFIKVREGSHNGTVHPSGKFFYNSNSSLYTDTVLLGGGQPGIEVYSITDIDRPRRVTKLNLPPIPASLGTESHDITFNRSGSRAYSAALSQGVIINTNRPAKPKIVSSIVDPTINVWHQADPVTLTAPNGKKRKFLIAEDEYAGAAGGPHCPSGGVHVYEITGAMEKRPVKVGYWNIDDMRLTTTATGRCTAHVFDIHQSEGIMTMAFYNGGVRVIDLRGLAGIGLGNTTVAGNPMKEIAKFYFANSDTWAVKSPRIHKTGNFYLYGNDVNRGLDIYKFIAHGAPSSSHGTWMTAAQYSAAASTAEPMAADYKPLCLLPPR